MSDFVEECRREWRRLGVPEPVANEMAADLTADLEEAEAEGGSPEDVLGNSAFDPRRFAAAWAAARGVTSAPTPYRPPPWRTPIAIALSVVVGVLTIGAGLALAVGRSSSLPSWRSPPNGPQRFPGRSGSSHRAPGGSWVPAFRRTSWGPTSQASTSIRLL